VNVEGEHSCSKIFFKQAEATGCRLQATAKNKASTKMLCFD
jgi:hypothetical protein